MGASLNSGGGGGGRRRRGRGRAPMSEINVTPFVDVMLVLLIIFMVAAPLLTAGVPVDLPEGKGKSIEALKKEPVQLTVTADGKFYFGSESEKTISLDELIPRLKATFEARGGDKDDSVFIRGDKNVNYGAVTRVLTKLRSSGFQKATLVIESEQGG